MIFKVVFLSLFLIICLSIGMIVGVGCGEDDPLFAPDPAQPTPVLISGDKGPIYIGTPGGDGLDRFDSTILISISESYQPADQVGEPQISVNQATDRIYGCCNYSIVNAVETGPGGIRFWNRGIFRPEICLTAEGVATASSYFEIPHGTYKIEFVNGDLVDTYKVRVDELSIVISPSAGSFTHMAHNVFWRHRPNSFALFCGTLNETVYLCDDIVDSLLAHVELEEFFYPDTGVVGYGRSSMGHYFDASARYFLYEDEADFQKAGAVLEEFVRARRSELHGVGISIRNWRNESYLSWMVQ